MKLDLKQVFFISNFLLCPKNNKMAVLKNR